MWVVPKVMGPSFGYRFYNSSLCIKGYQKKSLNLGTTEGKFGALQVLRSNVGSVQHLLNQHGSI